VQEVERLESPADALLVVHGLAPGVARDGAVVAEEALEAGRFAVAMDRL
jgi:hypothetical protein